MARTAATALLLLLTALLSAAAQPVLDLDGKEVRLDARYHLRRSTTNRIVGGLVLESINGSCPKYVNDGFELDRGLPAVFYPGEAPPGSKRLELGMKVNIRFPTARSCKGLSNYWFVDQSSSPHLVIGGQKGGEFTNSWFYLTRGLSSRSYKLFFCPCLRCRIACSSVGAGDGGLVLDGAPTEITLAKA